MENVNSENSVTNKHSFWTDKKAKEVFANVDYHLKSGMHIQREHPKPEEVFRFVERNYDELVEYYRDFFQVNLCQGGSNWNKYYYIDFEEGSRGKIPAQFRSYLSTESVIIGLLFLKIYKIDANIELDKISEFKKMLFAEYEEEKNGLLKLLADAATEKSSDFNDKKVEDAISKSFELFDNLGWIVKDIQDKDKFKCMPSFERLRKMYEPQILGIDELIKKQNNEG